MRYPTRLSTMARGKAADTDKPKKGEWYIYMIFGIMILNPIITVKSTGGAKAKKITPYNKFMKDELARLKESSPDMKHPER